MKELDRKFKALKCLIVMVFVLGFMKISNAQDLIIKNNNSTIQCKVLKISNSEIEYKKWTNLDGPIYTIDVEDVLRINYQNGESEIFNDGTSCDNIRGFMTRYHGDLVLNGKVLSNDEIKTLFGKKDYETYMGAKKQIHAGEFFAFMFIISAVGDVVGLNGMINGDTEQKILQSAAILYGSLLLTNVSVPLMCVFYGIGNGRIKWLVNDFNDKHSGFMSLNLSPCIMNSSSPQLQNYYGVGLTLRMRF